VEDSDILDLNTKGLYAKIGGGEVEWDVKVTVLNEYVSFMCVRVVNKIYL
jgi:hypothetical protein